ncbi:hypothetical protein CWIS_05990 [Cellulomonas sp. A375-1]|uniref:LLM class flavin-dependent oxidoreductase n=1 Tax=unclassified Cellulomonas TaxID=2620175 RepID=UPI0006528088|nr:MULTISPECIES: LLM class flavin-dependent oxidoreductase [unclassified Cellulomonas]KMM46283.1 hypothetical protein CWIS_05990 [Cellulomonas sp. A375-1]MCR6704570.1 LLM class flavin-dependent oxidoreductase [Cellulomonas sp.]
MAQPLTHVRAPRPRVADDLVVRAPLPAAQPSRGTEFVIDDATLDPTTIALAAARADVIRIRHGAGLPTHAAVRALVQMLDDEVAAVGRDRADVLVVLEVETVVADDEADAHRRREHLMYAAAFSHLAWLPGDAMLVAPIDALAEAVAQVLRRTGVDAVELALVGPSRRLVPEVAAALHQL